MMPFKVSKWKDLGSKVYQYLYLCPLSFVCCLERLSYVYIGSILAVCVYIYIHIIVFSSAPCS